MTHDFFLAIAVALAATLYASVGHGGASAYLAILTLAGRVRPEIAVTVLVMNVLVSSISWFRFRQARHFDLPLTAAFLLFSAPAAFVGGLLPISGADRSTGEAQLARHFRVYDHRADGVDGLFSVVGVKYTTARDVAEKVIDLVFQVLGKKPPRSVSAYTPLYGGRIERFEAFLSAESARRPHGLPPEIVCRLIYNYGSAYGQVLRYLEGDANGSRTPPDLVLKAETVHGVREEMAQKLADIVLRRTELGTAGHPGDQALRLCAEVMGEELGWNRLRVERELQEVNEAFIWASEDEENGGARLANTVVQ